MAHLRIHCGDCGSVWEVHKYLPDGAAPAFCPQCGSEIDGDIWENEIIPAFGNFHEINKRLIERHALCNVSPFYIDVIADHYTMDEVQS